MTEYRAGIPFSVEGDEHGYVILRDIMGSDSDIAHSARISYDNRGPSEDRTLLRYLLRHKHTSPFEMAELKFEVKMPIFVARQWIRHRTANVNEVSARYTQLPDEMFVPEEFQFQSKDNKQGRDDDVLSDNGLLKQIVFEANSDAYYTYERILSAGVSREQARGVLPLNIYTKMIWKIDLHNLFHFLKLRTDPHAQKEIRMYAEVLERIVQAKFPLAHEAWVDYSKESYTLSRMERDIFKRMVSDYVGFRSPDFRIENWCRDLDMSQRETDAFKKEFFDD